MCVRALVALCALGACLALAACGSSGSSTSASTTTGTGTSASKAGSGSSRFTALRSCLQKQGIALPARTSGGSGGPGGPGGPGGSGGSGAPGFPGGTGARHGLQPPEGVSQAKFDEALKKCGASFRGRGSANLNSATAHAALNTYAACMRSNGVNVPAPNTSGNGPIFNTTGINTSSTQFKTAQSKCQSDLKGVFPGGGAGGAPPSTGA